MNRNLKTVLHAELDILIAAMEDFEGDTTCCPTLKLMSEKVLGEEEENFANVVYESELTRLNNNSYVLEGRVRVSKLYMMDTWDKVHEPYSVEVIEILDDGSEGGAIEVEGSVPCVNCECNTCFGDNRCVECTGCAKGEKYKNPNCNGVRK